MTTLEMLEKVIANEIDEDTIAKATEMKEKALARNEKRKGMPSKATEANLPIRSAIIDLLKGSDTPMLAEDITNALEIEGVTLAKVRGILGNMAKVGEIVKGDEVGVAKSKAKKVYSLAE